MTGFTLFLHFTKRPVRLIVTGVRHPLFLSLLTPLLLMVVLGSVLEPRWETNDDVAMSMAAHGYGLAARGGPQLVFSQVVWGYIVRVIPDIHGLLGYSTATLTVLVGTGWALMYFLTKLGVPIVLAAMAMILVLARPMLFPQFTVTAGLLGVAAVLGWQAYSRNARLGCLLAGCLLAFLAYLIRTYEFLLVLAVSAPVLPWCAIRECRRFQVAIVILIGVIAGATVLERHAYSGSDWAYFQAINKARAAYTDFGAGEMLKRRPDVIARYGFSVNDIDLFSKWFLVDPHIADPQTTSTMLSEVRPYLNFGLNSEAGLTSLSALSAPSMLPVLLVGTILLCMAFRLRVIFIGLAMLLAMFGFGLLGRPGILRLYVPLASLLFVCALVAGESTRPKLYRTAVVLMVGCAFNAWLIIPEAVAARNTVRQIQQDMLQLPVGSLVTWGGAFPYQSVFPLLDCDAAHRRIRLYVMGVFNPAPFSVAAEDERAGYGMIRRLLSPEGVPIISTSANLDLLAGYCRERLKGKLVISAAGSASISYNIVRCEVPQ